MSSNVPGTSRKKRVVGQCYRLACAESAGHSGHKHIRLIRKYEK